MSKRNIKKITKEKGVKLNIHDANDIMIAEDNMTLDKDYLVPLYDRGVLKEHEYIECLNRSIKIFLKEVEEIIGAENTKKIYDFNSTDGNIIGG